MKHGQIISFIPSDQPRQHCWNKNWLHPYESPWSMFEKFKYANQVSTKDILRYFGEAHIAEKKAPKPAKKDCNLTTLDGFNSGKMLQCFGINPKAMQALIST